MTVANAIAIVLAKYPDAYARHPILSHSWWIDARKQFKGVCSEICTTEGLAWKSAAARLQEKGDVK